jgi:hypothetical protein
MNQSLNPGLKRDHEDLKTGPKTNSEISPSRTDPTLKPYA